MHIVKTPPMLDMLASILGPVNTVREITNAVLLLGGMALVLALSIDFLVIGVLGPPFSIRAFAPILAFAIGSALVEEIGFRGLPYWLLRGADPRSRLWVLVIGTIIWVTLHPFFGPPNAVFYVGSTSLVGLLSIKLWRGPHWWLGLLFHPLYNAIYITLRNYLTGF